MAEEVVVREPLSKELLEAGQKLTRMLAQRDLELKWAFWLYTSEANEWRLILATPLVDKKGPKYVYSRIREICGSSDDPTLSLMNTSAQGMHNPYVEAFESANLRYDLRISNLEPPLRLTRQRVSDVFVEDAVLYQVPDQIS